MSKLQNKICSEQSAADRIIEAAIPLFAAKGLTGVSVRELAGAAQVNIGSISYYFKGKEGLYITILERQFEKIMPLAQSVIEFPGSPPQKFQYWLKIIADIYQQSPFTFKLLLNEINNPTCYFEAIKKYIVNLQSILKPVLTEGISKGYFRADLNIACLAVMIHGMVQLAFMFPGFSKIFFPGQEDERDYFSQATDYLLRGILAPDKKLD